MPRTGNTDRKRASPKGRKYVKRPMQMQVRKPYKVKQNWREKVLDDMASRVSPGDQVRTDRQTGVATFTLDTRILQSAMINLIEPFTGVPGDVTTAGLRPNRRLGTSVHLSGWRIKLQLTNLVPEPMIFHYAIVQPRGSTVVSGLDFFKDYNDSRDIGFSVTTSGNTMNYPINPERFEILTHRRIELGRLGVGIPEFNANNAKNYASRDWWIPFKRDIAFTDETGTLGPTNPIYAVYWVHSIFDVAGDLPQSLLFKVHHDCIAFYKDKI